DGTTLDIGGKIVGRVGSEGVFGTENISDRAGDGLALDGVDLAIPNEEVGAIGAIEIGADGVNAGTIVDGVDPAGADQGGAVADVPKPIILEESQRVAEVVAARMREERSREFECHPVDDMLLARISALGLPALAEVGLDHFDRVKSVGAIVDETADS